VRRARIVLTVLTATVTLAGSSPGAAGAAAARSRDGIWVKIRRTEYGIPHILAHDFESLGYGYGYAFAQDNLCTIAEDYVTVDAQRSRYFGPNGSYLQAGNGITVNNLSSDLFFQQIIDSGVIGKLLSQPPPNGPKPQVIDAIRGYVRGYNRYLHDVGGAAGVPDPRCRGKAWVHPITTAQAWRRFYQLVLLAGYDVVIDGIADASPPAPGASGAAFDPRAAARTIATRWRALHVRLGSNAVAIGSAGTRDHTHGLLLGNPHFPWHGPERFYQAQLTIPGVVNVTGASLYGVPVVLIGHTPTMAWSHTVSTAYRFTPYQLTLVPGQPTQYLQDGQPTPMDPRTVSVMARQPDGSLRKVTRTLWWTRYGPVFDDLVGVPLPWTPSTAFAIRDVNAANFRVLNHFLDTDMASSALEELRILKRYQGIPWVNTIVADRRGHALYADIGAIPHVTDDEAQQCDTALGQGTFELLGLPVLDGSRTDCDWGSDPGAAVPGIFGPGHEPSLLRGDYVTNSNDSYWLANPHHPLTGFARIIGTEGTARTLRTRIGLVMAQRRVEGTDHLGPPGFTRKDMQHMVFGDGSYAAMITKRDLVSMCRQFEGAGGAPTSNGPPVAVGNSCDVLAAWNGRENLTSRGAVLFRRFWDLANGATPSPYSHPFDPDRPVTTPYGLDTNNPQVQQAFGDALSDLDAAHVPFDATVGSRQYIVKDGVRFPIHGGMGDPHGDFNAIWTSWKAGHGLTRPDGGSSFVQVVTWSAGPCPNARTILTYGESENPASPHFTDQTRLFSHKRWVVDRFCGSQIAASPALRVTTLTAP